MVVPGPAGGAAFEGRSSMETLSYWVAILLVLSSPLLYDVLSSLVQTIR